MSFEDIIKRGEREIDQILHRQGHELAYDTSPIIPVTHPIPATPTAQEGHVSKLQDAQNALAAIAGNPLIDAIAEAGIGLACGPAEVGVVLNVIRAIENGPGAHQQAEAAESTTATDAADAQPAAATFTPLA